APALHSLPTRRSSDLPARVGVRNGGLVEHLPIKIESVGPHRRGQRVQAPSIAVRVPDGRDQVCCQHGILRDKRIEVEERAALHRSGKVGVQVDVEDVGKLIQTFENNKLIPVVFGSDQLDSNIRMLFIKYAY